MMLAFDTLTHGMGLQPIGQAYLDPGSGSLIVQTLVGGLLALSFVLKTQWWRVRNMLGKQMDVHSTETEADEVEGLEPTKADPA